MTESCSLTIFGCGYNAFGQLSTFNQVNDSLHNFLASGVDQQNKDFCVTMTSPTLISRLQPQVKVADVAVTWSRLAVSLQKEKHKVTVVTGDTIINTKQNVKKNKLILLENTVAVTANQKDIFLQNQSTECGSEFSVLQCEESQATPLVLKDDRPPGSDRVMFYGSHSDVFYTRGPMEFGQLTSSNGESETTLNFIFSPIDAGIKIAQVSCGKEHVLILSCFGSLYSQGLSSRGQLGHGDVEREETPRLVEALEGVRIRSCSAGGWHSASVSEYGDAYTWGWDESGQLGLTPPPDAAESTSQPSQGIVTIPQCVTLPGDVTVKAVACGSRHTLILSGCGQVFSSGWNAYGQLGHNNTQNQSAFVKVSSIGSTCSQIFAGHWVSVFVCSK